MADAEKEKFVVRSVRAAEDVFAKLKELSSSGQFANQGEALSYLVNLYNLEQAKEQAGREAEIDDFHGHVNRIMDMYLESIALASDTEDRVRKDFQERMENQEKTIKELRDSRDFAQNEMRELQELNAEKDKQLEQIAADKDKEIAQLTQECDAAKTSADKAQEDHERLSIIIDNANQSNRELREKLEAQTVDIESMREAVAENADLKQELAEAEEKVQAIDSLKLQVQDYEARVEAISRHLTEAQEHGRDMDAKYVALQAEMKNSVKEAELRVRAERQDSYDKLQIRYNELSYKYDDLRDRFDELRDKYNTATNQVGNDEE